MILVEKLVITEDADPQSVGRCDDGVGDAV